MQATEKTHRQVLECSICARRAARGRQRVAPRCRLATFDLSCRLLRRGAPALAPRAIRAAWAPARPVRAAAPRSSAQQPGGEQPKFAT
jgi:hypothetical protein